MVPNLLTRVYTVFTVLNARRLFKTWPGRPGDCLKPAFNQVPAFINGVQFSVFSQVDLLLSRFFVQPDKLSLGMRE